VENKVNSYNASKWQMGFNSAFKGLSCQTNPAHCMYRCFIFPTLIHNTTFCDTPFRITSPLVLDLTHVLQSTHPEGAVSSSDARETFRLPWKPDVHYRVQSRSSPDDLSNDFIPFNTSCLMNIQCGMVSASSSAAELFLPFVFCAYNFVCIFISRTN